MKRATEAHDWNALLELCSAEHRKTQLGEMHQDKATYLAEILGVHSLGNALNDNRVRFDDLARIKHVTFVDITAEADGWYTVLGIVELDTHPPLRLELRISTHGAKLQLDGAVG